MSDIRVNDERAQRDVPWAHIEPGIRESVRVLNSEGFRTLQSCEGHGVCYPWVTLEHADPLSVAAVLHKAGAQRFVISERYEFRRRTECSRLLVVEFMGRPVP